VKTYEKDEKSTTGRGRRCNIASPSEAAANETLHRISTEQWRWRRSLLEYSTLDQECGLQL
jgi:hypothetical protein